MQPNSGGIIIIFVQCCIGIILIFVSQIYIQFDFSSELLIYFACLFLFILTIWSFWSWQHLTKSLFDPYTLFFLSAVIFNGGQAFLEIFHLNEDGLLEGNFSSETIIKTIFIVILSLTFFHLGALLNTATVNSFKQPSDGNKALLKNIQDNCRQVGWVTFGIALFPTILVFKDAVVTVFKSGYYALYQENEPTSFSATPQVLASFLIPSTLFLLVGSKEKRNTRLVCLFSILIYAFSHFFLGERNSAVMPLIAFGWLWHRWIRPLPKLFMFSTAVLLGFFVLPLVAATRNESGQERLSINFLLETFSSIDNPVIASIAEMGGTMQTVAYTLELVPRWHDFEMGVGYLYALLTLIPNFFWSIHPTVARGIPDLWLAQEIDPERAARGGTLGFSFIAEAYLNFGWIGTPIILGIIGFLYGKLTLWAMKSNHPAKMAMLASFTTFFLFYPRAEAALVVRALVWYSLIPYLGVYILNRSQLRGLSRQRKF